ncbi:MAG: FAD-binding oxidoreductase [Notoacmeibacter sp.]|nr:FAD-binding oxidoreductase [Notoacmeibacter sp.]
MPMDYDVVIAGAGVIGASTAFHLARRGMRVAVIDATGPAAAASGASDGAVSVASKKPGVMARLATASLLYTRSLAQTGGPLHGIYSARPGYFFATDPAEELALDSLISKLSGLGGPVTVTADGNGNIGLAGLGPTVRRLVTLTGEGHMLGFEAVRAYLSAANIETIWPDRLMRWEADDAGITVETSKGHLRAGKMVAALGVSSAALFPDLPVLPRAGQLIVTDRAPGQPLPGALTAASYLIAKTAERRALPNPPVVIDPLVTGQFLIGSSREDHGDPSRVDFPTMRKLVARAVEVWPALGARQIIRTFAGIRAAVIDGMPIVGAVPQTPRLILATGFEGDGICLSAVMGREIAAMVAGEPVTDGLAADISALTPRRFEIGEARSA